MELDENKVNSVIGELLIKEKYKFLPEGCIGEICRDFVEEWKNK